MLQGANTDTSCAYGAGDGLFASVYREGLSVTLAPTVDKAKKTGKSRVSSFGSGGSFCLNAGTPASLPIRF